MKEISSKASSGGPTLFASFLLLILSIFVFAIALTSGQNILSVVAVLLFALFIFMLPGFFTIQPNEAMVMVLFGKYVGTLKKEGWHWANPFYTKKKISLRSRNINGERIKVNDEMGNPIEIAAVIVWKVENTARHFLMLIII